MRYAIIENNIVTNVIEALGEIPGLTMASAENAGIGWLYADGILTKPPVLPPTRDQLKAEREAAVAAITVTTQAGNTFDGDEVSQTRMARAIIALQATGTPSVNWVLTDNTVIDAPVAELVEALALSGAAQAALWVIE